MKQQQVREIIETASVGDILEITFSEDYKVALVYLLAMLNEGFIELVDPIEKDIVENVCVQIVNWDHDNRECFIKHLFKYIDTLSVKETQ